MKGIPVLAVYGDYFEVDARWATIRRNGLAYYERVRAAGGNVKVVDLPAAGIRGNSHMIPMDRNNLEVAALIQGWLAEQPGLYQ